MESDTTRRLDLNDEEARKLGEILDRGFDPPPALLESLRRLADPGKQAPELKWTLAVSSAKGNARG